MTDQEQNFQNSWDNRMNILTGLRNLLKPSRRIICLDSTPELYINECASFTTKDFPENRKAKTGDIVRCIMHDVEDKRPCGRHFLDSQRL